MRSDPAQTRPTTSRSSPYGWRRRARSDVCTPSQWVGEAESPERGTRRDQVSPHEEVRTYAADARNERDARRMVATCLDAWGMGSERQAFELVASELFANAVCHGRGPVDVRLSADADLIRLEVRDEGGGQPALLAPDPTGERLGGWGLQLVDQLADAWGAEVADGHTLVWAERRHRDAVPTPGR